MIFLGFLAFCGCCPGARSRARTGIPGRQAHGEADDDAIRTALARNTLFLSAKPMHALLRKQKVWRLSPACDLVPAPVVSLERRAMKSTGSSMSSDIGTTASSPAACRPGTSTASPRPSCLTVSFSKGDPMRESSCRRSPPASQAAQRVRAKALPAAAVDVSQAQNIRAKAGK